MPYTLKKVDGYQVRGPSGVHAKSTTLAKAKRQMRLLHGVEYGWTPTGKAARDVRKKRKNKYTEGLGKKS